MASWCKLLDTASYIYTNSVDGATLTKIIDGCFESQHFFSSTADIQMTVVLLTVLLCGVPRDTCVTHVHTASHLQAEPAVCGTVVCKHSNEFRCLWDSGLQTQQRIQVSVGQWSANTATNSGV